MSDIIISLGVPLLSAFLMGLFRGSSICLTVCAPAIFPLILSKRSDLGDSFKLAMLITMPRTLILAIAGGAVGVVMFYILHRGIQPLLPAFSLLHLVSYLLLGSILVVLGAIFFSRASKERKAGSATSCSVSGPACKACALGKRRSDTSLFTSSKLNLRDQLFLGGWGVILSMGCLVEVFILEGPVITAASAVGAPGALSAFGISFTALLLFGVGSSIPLILVALLTSVLHTKLKSEKVLYNLKVISSIIIMIMGTVLLIRSGIEMAVLVSIGL